MTRLLTTEVAAQRLGVTQRTIRRYIAQRKIAAVRTPGGHHRIARDELDRVVKAAANE